MRTRYAVCYRFAEDGERLVLETTAFSVEALHHARSQGWVVVITDIDMLLQQIEDTRRADERGFWGLGR